jgi:DNA-binding MarR family transcriptional regulator
MTAHSRELETEKLLQLSDQVSRIANNLARLSAEAGVTGTGGAAITPDNEAGETVDVPLEIVRAVIRARRLRANYFESELFADPAWDILLDLLQAELSHRRVAVSSLCMAAAVPATTALRWINSMVDKGLIMRRADQFDGRRVWVELTPPTSLTIRRYFAEIGGVPAA